MCVKIPFEFDILLQENSSMIKVAYLKSDVKSDLLFEISYTLPIHSILLSCSFFI